MLQHSSAEPHDSTLCDTTPEFAHTAVTFMTMSCNRHRIKVVMMVLQQLRQLPMKADAYHMTIACLAVDPIACNSTRRILQGALIVWRLLLQQH